MNEENKKQLFFNDGFDNKETFNLKHVGLEGEAIFKAKDTGETLYRKKNTILVNGKTFVLCKIFNINVPEVITLNNLMNVNLNEDPYDYTGPRRETAVCLFGVGIGGSDITLGTAYAPNPREYNLYNQIPLRYVDTYSDLSDEDRQRYFMRKEDTVNSKIGYYLKKFDQNPVLVRKVGSTDYMPSINDNQRVDTSTTIIQRTAVDVYVEMKFTIEATDVREFFIANNDLKHSRINEICLYTGYKPEDSDDYCNVAAFSKLTFDTEALSSYEKSIEVTYRIYC